MARNPAEQSRLTRRRFLAAAARTGAGALAAAALPGCVEPGPSPLAPPVAKDAERYVLVRFGGGVRFDDVFGSRERCLAPYLRSLARSGTLFTNLWNGNLTRHDTGTRYLLTGRYGTRGASNADGDANLAELAAAPTLLTEYRAKLGAAADRTLVVGTPDAEPAAADPKTRALSFAPLAPLPAAPLSGDPSLGVPVETAAANLRLGRIVKNIEDVFGRPNVPRAVDQRRLFMQERVLDDLAGEPLRAPGLNAPFGEALAERLSADQPFVMTDEADDFVLDISIRAMHRVRPDLAVIAFSTPDLAHAGSWRSYAAQLTRIDLLLMRLHRFLETDIYYQGRTALLVVPDCGRGTQRFDQHAEPFADESQRRLFLLATGCNVPAGVVVEDRREQIDVAPTIATRLGFEIPDAEGSPLQELA